MKISLSVFKICILLTIIIFVINQRMQSGVDYGEHGYERSKIEITANRGNTNNDHTSCFLNSVIQALYHLEPFRFTFEPEKLDVIQNENSESEIIINNNNYNPNQERNIRLKNITDPIIEYSKNSVPKALFKHIDTMARSKNEDKPIDPSKFREKFSFYSSATMNMVEGQHDAAEFYTLLIDQLWQQIAPMEKARDSFLQLFKKWPQEEYKKHESNIEYLWEFIAGELHKNIIVYTKDNELQNLQVLLDTVNKIQNEITKMISFQAESKKEVSDYNEQLYLSVLKDNNIFNKYDNDENSWLYQLIPSLANVIRFRNETMKKLLGSTIQLPLTCKTNQSHKATQIKNKPSPWLWTLPMNINEETNLKKLMTENQFIPEKDEDNRCETNGCNGCLESTEQINLIEPPDILTIQLGRFIGVAKNNQLFEIPEALNSDETGVSWEGDFYYKLYAIVVHKGKVNDHGAIEGHYWAYARDSHDTWYCYNDMVEETNLNPKINIDQISDSFDFSNYYIASGQLKAQGATNDEIEKILRPQYKTPEEAIQNGQNVDVWPTPYMLFYVKTQGSADEELSEQLEKEDDTPEEFESSQNNKQMLLEERQKNIESEDPNKLKKKEEEPLVLPQPGNQPKQNINQSAVSPTTNNPNNPVKNQSQNEVPTSNEEQGFFASIATAATNTIQWVAQTLWNIASFPFRWLFGN